MLSIRIGIIFCLLVGSTGVFSAELQRIVLQDGSSVNAEVLTLNNGVYTLRSPALGKFSVNADQIRSIQSIRGNVSQVQTPSRSQDPRANMEQIQSSLLANPDTIKLIMALQHDPDIKAILEDGDIMAAIQRGDYDALANNPKIKSLMNKPEIQQITNSVAQ